MPKLFVFLILLSSLTAQASELQLSNDDLNAVYRVRSLSGTFYRQNVNGGDAHLDESISRDGTLSCKNDFFPGDILGCTQLSPQAPIVTLTNSTVGSTDQQARAQQFYYQNLFENGIYRLKGFNDSLHRKAFGRSFILDLTSLATETARHIRDGGTVASSNRSANSLEIKFSFMFSEDGQSGRPSDFMQHPFSIRIEKVAENTLKITYDLIRFLGRSATDPLNSRRPDVHFEMLLEAL